MRESPQLNLIEAEVITARSKGRIGDGVKSGHYVYIPLDGSLSIRTTRKRVILRPGDIGWIGAGLERVVRALEPSKWVIIRLRNRAFAPGNPADAHAWQTLLQLGKLSRQRPCLSTEPTTHRELQRLGLELTEWALNTEKASVSMMKACVLRFLGILQMDQRTGDLLSRQSIGETHAGIVQKAMILIEKEGTSIGGIDSLSARAGASRSTLYRAFAQAGLPSPAVMLEQVRLERATRMLRQTPKTVLAVALETGFASLSAFYRAFHRTYKVPPGRWRQGM